MTATDEGVAVHRRLQEIRGEIAAACARVGRDPSEVTVIGASKRQSVERMRAAWEAGLRIFGENRVQEAAAKREELPAEAAWHLIGPLQSNKARPAVELFTTVHSVDRWKIARFLDREARRAGRELPVLLEVNLGGEESKHGFAPDQVLDRAERIAAELDRLRVLGLMAIPPFEEEPEAMRPWFRRLRELRDRLLQRPGWSGCPGDLSMGMSNDYEVAVEEGATFVRIGTALFGERG